MKHYLQEDQIDEYYQKGFDVYMETYILISANHSHSDNMEDPKNLKTLQESVKYYVEIEGMLN